MEITEDFDGFITSEGQLISIENVDEILSILSRRTENANDIIGALWGFAEMCADAGRPAAAYRYFEKVLALVDTPNAKAECLLAMGQAMERARDYKAALEAYSRAFELPQEPNPAWYFLHNNLGYCLNFESRYAEAEAHCRAAIEVDPDRHNAHKNLGIALQGQGRYSEAARSFITAVMACPEDGRSLEHLENLVAAHGEILEQEPGLQALRWKCHEAVQKTRGEDQPQ